MLAGGLPYRELLVFDETLAQTNQLYNHLENNLFSKESAGNQALKNYLLYF